MWLFKFYNACKKYQFTFVLSTYCGLSLILRPVDTYENIELKEKYYWNEHKFYKNAIDAMKEYRKTHK